MKIVPMQDYVLVQRERAEERTEGGIIVPQTAQERPQRGEVLAVGPGRYLENGEREPHGISPGDVVLFPKYVSAEKVARVFDDPDAPVLIRASELLAVVLP